ncbi:hypothetical protein ACFPFP_42130, partial [Bradyrhizobium sp. GCM10023182]|nr:hypothetical protein [Bradyrhizobium zhengyangense]
ELIAVHKGCYTALLLTRQDGPHRRETVLPTADVVRRFNPAFGQGMTVAAQEVAVLEWLLRERVGQPGPLDRLAQAFFVAIQSVLVVPWSVAESDFMYEEARGTRPADFV